MTTKIYSTILKSDITVGGFMVQDKKDNDIYTNSNDLEDDYNNYRLDKNIRVVPTFEAIKIIALYTFLGVLWIFITDYLLTYFVQNQEIRAAIQLYKGWFYVIFTAFIFFPTYSKPTTVHISTLSIPLFILRGKFSLKMF